MPGKESVYARQGGTGAAAILGGTSWDPVQAAKYAGALGQAKKDADDLAKQKKKDALYNLLKIAPSKSLAEDQNQINNLGDDFLKHKAAILNAGGEYDYQKLYGEAQKYAHEFEQIQNSSKNQDLALNAYLGQLKGSAGKLDNDAMIENGAIYANPELYVDSDPDIAASFSPILEMYMNDPFYGEDPDRALLAAKTHWRNDAGREYVTEPLLSDESLMDDYRKNVLPLVAEKNKQHFGKTLSDGTYVDEQYTYTLPYDTKVTTKDGEEITIIGTRTAELERYDDSPSIKKSADNRFKKLDEDTKQNYIDQYGDDAAKNWNADNLSKFGVQSDEAVTKRTPQSKSTSYSIGGSNYDSPYDIVPFEAQKNINYSSDPKKDATGSTHIRGYTISQGEGTSKKNYTLTGVSPSFIFRTGNGAQIKNDNSYEIQLDDASMVQMATTKGGLTWKTLAEAKTYDGKSVLEEFKKKFGTKYANADFTNDIDNIVVTDDVAEFLSDNGLGEYLEDKTYMSGKASFYQPSGKKGKGDVIEHYSDALIPIDGKIDAKIQGDLGLPLHQKLLVEYKPKDYTKGVKTNKKKNNNTVVTTEETEVETDNPVDLKVQEVESRTTTPVLD